MRTDLPVNTFLFKFDVCIYIYISVIEHGMLYTVRIFFPVAG